MAKFEGRLELTWTNKHLRLLAHENGSYEWISPADYRVAEVRLLHDVASVGAVGKRRASDNLLIRGDALNALTSLSRLPEFAREYLGKVKLVYVDPPFNTQQSFLQYDDALEHSVWLTMMRDRLIQIRDLLAPDGSVWVHCDDSEQAYLKAMMDEVFGRAGFVATIVWQKRSTRENRKAIGSAHDYIVVYSPLGVDWSSVRNKLPRDAKSLKQYSNPNGDPRGHWRTVPMDAQGYRPNQMYTIQGPTGKTFTPPRGRCWSMVEERYRSLLAAGRIWFGVDETRRPMVIRYLDEDEGLVPGTWWPSVEAGHSGEAKREILALFPGQEAFQTPKPERLMHRIIHIASSPGDIVLDCFLGSGTTAAVAHKMARRWIGVELAPETIADFALPRLTKVVEGKEPGGVTEEMSWKGGAGFRVLEVAPSMFEADEGLVFLAEWMTNGNLAEATAAQFGFDYEADPPFSGRKGRTRLAVVDGVVNESVVRLLVNALPEGQRAVVCGTGIDTEARPVLRELRPGSTLRKIPAALLDEFRSGQLRLILDSDKPASRDGHPVAAGRP